ncbi:MAG: MFS transporter [Pseudoclavibacter sp.]
MSAPESTTAPTPATAAGAAGTKNVPPIGGRYQYLLLVIMSAVFGFVFFDRMIINTLMPFISVELDLSNTQIGIVGGMSALTWAISALIMGWLSDRIDRRKSVLVIAIILFTIFSVASGFVGGIASLLVLRSLLGFSEGGTMPAIQSLIFFSTEEKKRGLFVGIVQGSAPGLLGGIITPLVGVWIAEQWGWRAAFFATVIPGLILTIIVLFFVRELRQRDAAAAGVRVSDEPQESAPSSRHLIRKMLTTRNVLLCLPIGLFYQAWFTITQIFTPTYLVQYRGLEPADMAFVMSGIGIAWLVWGAAIPAISDRIGRKPALILFTLIAALAPIILMFVEGAFPMFALLALTYMGLGCFVLFMTIIPGEAVDKMSVATVIGFVVGFSEITGGFLMPIIAGAIGDIVNLNAIMWIASGSAVVVAVLAMFIRESAPRKLAARQRV